MGTRLVAVSLGGLIGLIFLMTSGAPGQSGRPAAGAVAAQELASGRSVTVSGEGVAAAPADQASLVVIIQATRPAPTAALSEVSQVAATLAERLAPLGVTTTAIETEAASLEPPTERRSPVVSSIGSPPADYRASQRLVIALPTLERLDAAVEQVQAAGHQVIAIRLGWRDAGAVRAQAMGQALQATRAEAERLASPLGLRVGPVLTVQVEEPASESRSAAATTEPRTPAAIEPGPLTSRLRLRVSYSLIPR